MRHYVQLHFCFFSLTDNENKESLKSCNRVSGVAVVGFQSFFYSSLLFSWAKQVEWFEIDMYTVRIWVVYGIERMQWMLNDFPDFLFNIVEGVCSISICYDACLQCLFFSFCQGMLDKQFGLVHSLKESNSPFFLAEIIPMFCQNVQTILRDLTQTLYFSIFILMSRQIVFWKSF